MGQGAERSEPVPLGKAFAGWVVEGIHGILCSVLSKITGSDPANC